jgi:hypothetical protein
MHSIQLAQQVQLSIGVASTIQAAPGSQIVIPIQISPAGSLPNKCFVRLRGLPPYVSLGEGYSIAPGAWAVPIFALATLKAYVPTGVSGRYEVLISLVNIDGIQLAEARTALTVEPLSSSPVPIQKTPPRQDSVAPPAPIPANKPDRSDIAVARPPAPSAEEQDWQQKRAAQGERYVAQGERYLSEGNIAVARQFYQRAADVGYAQGAMRLAATYDPAEISQLNLRGITPDQNEARKWYQRARDLGAPGAAERLARLGRN